MVLPTEKDWNLQFNALLDSLRTVCNNPDDDNALRYTYNRVFLITYNLYVNSMKNIPIISKEDKLLLNRALGNREACNTQTPLVKTIHEVLALLEILDMDAYNVILNLLLAV